MLKKVNKKFIKIGDSSPISLTDGDNVGLIFDALAVGTYNIQILDGEEVITEETGIIVDYDREPEPSVIISDVVITDTTGTGNADGSVDATITISNFSGQGTATLTPDPNTISPITLTDGANPESFTNLPAGDYQVDIYDDETLVDSFTFTIADPDTPATATIDNITPTSPTTEDGTDGTIAFDTTITGCTGTATAVLNPTAGTTPITLTDGDNTGLSFSPLPAGDYTVQIYCDDTLIEESDTITVPEFVPTTPIDDVVVPDDGSLIPAEDTDIPTTNGATFNHPLLFTSVVMTPESTMNHYQNLIILGDYFNNGEWTTGGINLYNPNDGQGDGCYVALRKTSDILFNTDRQNTSNSISGFNYIKAVDAFDYDEILAVGEYESFTLSQPYTNYQYLILKQYYYSNAGTAQVEQYTYNIIDTAELATTNLWFLKRQANSDGYTNVITFTDASTGSLTSQYSNDNIISIIGTNSLETTDLNASIVGTTITLDDYSDATFLLVNSTEDITGASTSQIIYFEDIILDGTTRYDFNGIGTCYLSFNPDMTLNIVMNTSQTFTIKSIKKIIIT